MQKKRKKGLDGNILTKQKLAQVKPQRLVCISLSFPLFLFLGGGVDNIDSGQNWHSEQAGEIWLGRILGLSLKLLNPDPKLSGFGSTQRVTTTLHFSPLL